jgi:hypothetical protein
VHSIGSTENSMLKESRWYLYVLGVYFFIAYSLTSSEISNSGRGLIHFSILIFIFLIAVQLSLLFISRRKNKRKEGSWMILPLIITLVSCLSTVYYVVDYVVARLYWRDSGWSGDLFVIKERICLTLLLSNTVILYFTVKSSDRKPFAFFGEETPAFLLLVTAPVVQYFIANVEIFQFGDSVAYFSAFVFIPVAIAVLTSAARAFWGAPKQITIAVLGLVFAHYSLPSFHAALKISVGNEYLPHIAFAVAIPVFLCLLAKADHKLFKVLCLGYFCVNTSVVIFDSFFFERHTENANNAELVLENNSPISGLPMAKRKPDIFLLFYDGYPNETVAKYHGLPTMDQMEFLRSKNFSIYPNTHSLYLATLGSIGRMMSMSSSMSQNVAARNTVNSYLAQNGYETNLVLHPYFYQGEANPFVHNTYPRSEVASQLKTIFRGIGSGEFKSEAVFSEYSREEWLQAKRDVLRKRIDRPKFLYAHSGFPGHSQNSGKCLPNELEIFSKRLDIANEEMREDIETLLDENKNAVIVVASDHGPYLTGDCLYLTDRTSDKVSMMDLLDRYGVLLAIRWPDEAPYNFARPELLQDLFFSVFAYMTESAAILANRPERSTVGYGPTIRSGAIENGSIAFGSDKGRRIQEMSRDSM